MDMGERFRKARLEAGLSQAQLCKDVVSRNMLSQIEGGTAKPSLTTLEILAQRLNKPVGYFFGEETNALAGREQVEKAWQAYGSGNLSEAARILSGLEDPEKFGDLPLLRSLVILQLAEKAIQEKRHPYAGEMLHWIRKDVQNFPDLRRRALLLQGRLAGQRADSICRELPSLDGELLLRAEAELEKKSPDRAAQLLEAAQDHSLPQWSMLRGRVYLLQGHFRSAARCFHQAEQAFPHEASPYLEQCYRELEDYKQAYFYACRQK